ncbi:hypothetical protein ACJX0J_037508, partial [Zea mays]
SYTLCGNHVLPTLKKVILTQFTSVGLGNFWSAFGEKLENWTSNLDSTMEHNVCMRIVEWTFCQEKKIIRYKWAPIYFATRLLDAGKNARRGSILLGKPLCHM